MTVLHRSVLVRLHAISSGEHKASFVCLVGRSCLHGYAPYARAHAYSPHRVDCVGCAAHAGCCVMVLTDMFKAA